MPNTWSDFLEPEAEPIRSEQRQAIGIMHCLAMAIAVCRRRYGDQSDPEATLALTTLPVPVAVSAVCTDGVHFDFIHFQLNTLAFPDHSKQAADNLSNIAWIDGDHRLVDKIIPKRSMLRNTIYRDLNMDVFTRMLTTYYWSSLGKFFYSRKENVGKGEHSHFSLNIQEAS
ncbi:unnamed protein product [Protopolystoma xenopodis]|uniref:Large ribosomal subunit protein mL37 n=1 Tax=Protopolystoma xenopodis TaxID=117903 RepID=A0A3S5CUH4_9PLAT|nr:unnamed protein product [Protopolystoma xenopodis]